MNSIERIDLHIRFFVKTFWTSGNLSSSSSPWIEVKSIISQVLFHHIVTKWSISFNCSTNWISLIEFWTQLNTLSYGYLLSICLLILIDLYSSSLSLSLSYLSSFLSFSVDWNIIYIAHSLSPLSIVFQLSVSTVCSCRKYISFKEPRPQWRPTSIYIYTTITRQRLDPIVINNDYSFNWTYLLDHIRRRQWCDVRSMSIVDWQVYLHECLHIFFIIIDWSSLGFFSVSFSFFSLTIDWQ